MDLNFEVLMPLLMQVASVVLPIAIGAALLAAIQFVRPMLLGARERLEDVGRVIIEAMETFRDSETSPPELDSLINLVIDRWRVLSTNMWSITATALDEIEAKAKELAGVTRREQVKRNGNTVTT